MSTVAEIESAIEQLPPPQLSQLSRWFDECLEKAWDARMESDAKAGKFAHFKEEISQARARRIDRLSLKSKCLKSFWKTY